MPSKTIAIPDLGDVDDVEVIELLVNEGDSIAAEDPVIVLESAKASMDIPCPEAGVVESLAVKVGDKVNSGSPMLTLKTEAETTPAEEDIKHVEATDLERTSPSEPAAAPQSEPGAAPEPELAQETTKPIAADLTHASPAVRRIATERDVDLSQISGSGPHGRITKTDVLEFLGELTTDSNPAPNTQKDQTKTVSGETPLSRIQKISAQHLHSSWSNIPHVTHFDDADITELEAWRQQLKQQNPELKLSLLPFFMKVMAACLQAHPRFNTQLNKAADGLINLNSYHLGIAVDTADGLVVPVINDVNEKGVLALAKELAATAERARSGKLSPQDFKGGSSTISNLGGLGGQHFTPIINAPEVSILGLGQARWQLRRMGEPNTGAPIADRLIQPLALSYDHRVIDGALAAKFIATLKTKLEDIRQLLL